MPEDLIFQRRNRLKHHFVNTSNVLLWCYATLSDAARRLYQILDGFDYADPVLGSSKGYVYPSMTLLVTLMRKDESTVRRYLRELLDVKLITRQRRRNQPSLFIIEDIAPDQIERYYELRGQLFQRGGAQQGARRVGKHRKGSTKPDRSSQSEPTTSRTGKSARSHVPIERADLPVAYKEEEKEKKKKNDNVVEKTARSGHLNSLSNLLAGYQLPEPTATTPDATTQRLGKRDYLAQLLVSALDDPGGLGCYRRIVEKTPEVVIFQTLGLVKESAASGAVRTSKAALFVDHIKRYAQLHRIDLAFKAKGGGAHKPTASSADPR